MPALDHSDQTARPERLQSVRAFVYDNGFSRAAKQCRSRETGQSPANNSDVIR